MRAFEIYKTSENTMVLTHQLLCILAYAKATIKIMDIAEMLRYSTSAIYRKQK